MRLRGLVVALAVTIGTIIGMWRYRASAPRAPAEEPAPAPVPSAAPAPPAPEPPRSAPAPEPSKPTEAQEMARIRASIKSAPREALALLDAADRAHPGSAFAEERASLRIDALVYAGDIGVARDHAEEYLARYPDGAYAAHVEQLTGVHR
jgi:hypothetical protein